MAFNFDPVDGLMNVTSFPNKPASSTAARQQFQTLLNQLRDYINTNSSTVIIPTGSVFMILHQIIPSGYLELKGQAISRVDYQALWAIYGTTYGAGDGTNTFNLPDMRGCFPRGFDGGRGFDAGRVFGAYQADELKSHKHTSTFQYQKANAAPDDNNWSFPAVGDGGTPVSRTFADVNNTGGTETRPKNMTCIFIVKY